MMGRDAVYLSRLVDAAILFYQMMMRLPRRILPVDAAFRQAAYI